MAEMYEVKDSGKRQEFSTGARRDIQSGKGRFDLIPDYALFLIAKHFEAGAVKYGDDNWRKGIPLKRYFDSAMRHMIKAKLGMKDEPHFVAACWNLMCLIETQFMIDTGILPKELDDLPKLPKHMEMMDLFSIDPKEIGEKKEPKEKIIIDMLNLDSSDMIERINKLKKDPTFAHIWEKIEAIK